MTLLHATPKNTDDIKEGLRRIIPWKKNVVFFCVGSDKTTGDAFGPLVGTMLRRNGFNVIGHLHKTVYGDAVQDYIYDPPRNSFVVGIGAVNSQTVKQGILEITDRPLIPVSNKRLFVGEASISYAVCNVPDDFLFVKLSTISLAFIMDGADALVESIIETYKEYELKSAISPKQRSWTREPTIQRIKT